MLNSSSNLVMLEANPSTSLTNPTKLPAALPSMAFMVLAASALSTNHFFMLCSPPLMAWTPTLNASDKSAPATVWKSSA